MGLERFGLHLRMGATTKRFRTLFLLSYIIILEIHRIMAKTVMQLSDKDLPHLLIVLFSSSSSSILSAIDLARFPPDLMQWVLAGNNFESSEFAILKI